MRIVNGRKLEDTNGHFTCYSPNALIPSVIDYALVDDDLLQEITYFRVDGLTTHSDHCPVYLRLNVNFNTCENRQSELYKLQPSPPKFYWNEIASESFKTSVYTKEIKNQLERACHIEYAESTEGITMAVIFFKTCRNQMQN